MSRKVCSGQEIMYKLGERWFAAKVKDIFKEDQPNAAYFRACGGTDVNGDEIQFSYYFHEFGIKWKYVNQIRCTNTDMVTLDDAGFNQRFDLTLMDNL